LTGPPEVKTERLEYQNRDRRKKMETQRRQEEGNRGSKDALEGLPGQEIRH
jgi:hypothetical protein